MKGLFSKHHNKELHRTNMVRKSANEKSNSIPVIDLAPLSTNAPNNQHAIAQQLRSAFLDRGFLILINHGVSQHLIQQTFDEAQRFHNQSMEFKKAVLMNSHNNGYMSMGRYNVNTSRASDPNAKLDMNEAFFVKRERPADDPLVKSKRKFAGPNEWPANFPGFKEKLLEYTDTIDKLAKQLLAPLAISLNMPASTFDNAFWESQFSFRLSHYPAVKNRVEDQYGIAPHTDSNFLTFLAQSEAPGLQIQTDIGDWIDVPYVPNSIVVNSGDMLHRWTNGCYKSTPHRALPPLKKPRYAIPFFFGPHLDCQIECLPSCRSSDNPAKFPPISYGEYMDWWYESNYNPTVQKDL